MTLNHSTLLEAPKLSFLVERAQDMGAPNEVIVEFIRFQEARDAIREAEAKAELERKQAASRESSARHRLRQKLGLVTSRKITGGTPYSNLRRPLLRSSDLKEEEGKRERIELPVGWKPNEDHRAWAASVNRSEAFVKRKAKDFITYVEDRDEPWLSTDWDCQFQIYLERGHELTPKPWYKAKTKPNRKEEEAAGKELVELPAPDSKPTEPVGDPDAAEVQGDLETPPASPIGDPEADSGEIREPEPQGEIQEAGTVIPFPSRKPEPESKPEPDAKVVPLKAPQPKTSRDEDHPNYDPVPRTQPFHPSMENPERPEPDADEKARIEQVCLETKLALTRRAAAKDRPAKLEFPSGPKHPLSRGKALSLGVRIALDHTNEPDDFILEQHPEVDLEDVQEARRLLKEWDQAQRAYRVECDRLREEWRRNTATVDSSRINKPDL